MNAPGWRATGPLLTGVLALLVLVAGFGGWAATTRIAGAIIAAGTVSVARDHQVVQHPEGGVVTEIHAAEGDTVRAGEPLLQLDAAALRAEHAIIESELHEIAARRGRFEAERDGAETLRFAPELTRAAESRAELAATLDGQARLFAARAETRARQIETLELRREQLERQIDGVESERDALREQRRLVAAQLATQQTLLERGLTSEPRVRDLESEHARLTGSLGRLAAEQARTRAGIAEIDLEHLHLRAARREDAETRLRDLRLRALELAERHQALAERIAARTLRAPSAGVIHELSVTTPRAVIAAGDAVVRIVPQDRPLVVTVRVAPDDIDQIRSEQPATLKFTAFGMRDSPDLPARVVRVSPDAFTDRDTRQRHYRVEIAPDPGALARLEGRELKPGMQVEARIRTEPRTPMRYLLQPLTSYFDRAFREG